MDSPSADLKDRTKAFALRILRLFGALPKTTEARVLGKQVLRSGTAVGALYREAYRSRSSAEYITKIEIGLQELEETIYWIELLIEGGMVEEGKLKLLLDEANQLSAILVACVRKVRMNPGGKRQAD